MLIATSAFFLNWAARKYYYTDDDHDKQEVSIRYYLMNVTSFLIKRRVQNLFSAFLNLFLIENFGDKIKNITYINMKQLIESLIFKKIRNISII